MAQETLERRTRKAKNRESFVERGEAVCGDWDPAVRRTIEKSGRCVQTLPGFYVEIRLELQNRRQWPVAECVRYDRLMGGIIGLTFSDIALSNLDEYEYAERWRRIRSSVARKSELEGAYFLIRELAEWAYRLRRSDVQLWGVISRADPGGKDLQGKAVERARRGLRISAALPLRAEIAVVRLAFHYLPEHGEMVSILISIYCGTRTGETLGFCYGDLVEVCPGYWGLARRRELGPDGENTDHMKTSNAPRLIPLPRFLAAHLKARRDRCIAEYGEEKTAGLPLSCVGTDAELVTDHRLMNRIAKELFRAAGVKEEMISYAYEELSADPDAIEEYERSLVAYIGRHTMITDLETIGMPEEMIYALAGHKQMGRTTYAYDLANPDKFVEVSDLLNLRPVVMAFDPTTGPRELRV